MANNPESQTQSTPIKRLPFFAVQQKLSKFSISFSLLIYIEKMME
jgi:hypothetical protein